MKPDINIGRIKSFIDRHLNEVGCSADGVPPLSSIEFDLVGMCNRTCVFCPRSDVKEFPSVPEYMSLLLYEKIMRDLQGMDYTGRIVYSGFGEPLLHHDVLGFISCSKAICPKMTVEITTNGDPLTVAKLKALFRAGLDHIKISVYDGPDAHARFVKLRDEAGLTENQMILRGRWLPPDKHYGLTISNRAGSVSLPQIGVGPLQEPLRQSCYYPFYKMVVDYTGEVLICSNDWTKKLVVGDLNKSTVAEVWNGEQFNEVRKRLLNRDRSSPPCNVCDVHGLYNGEHHFAAWQEHYRSQADPPIATTVNRDGS